MEGNKKQNRGFTLIEALVAITILMVSIGGPLVIATKGLSTALFARDQITAFYLAQEAVEFVRSRRDSHGLAGVSWSNGVVRDFAACTDGGSCTVDIINNDIASCGGGGGAVWSGPIQTRQCGWAGDWLNSREIGESCSPAGDTGNVYTQNPSWCSHQWGYDVYECRAGGGSSCSVLQYDEATGFYNYDTGPDSRFTRSVSLTTVNANELAISVTVSWQSGLLAKSFTLRENIFNWQDFQ